MKIRENMVAVNTPRFTLRVWVNCGDGDPGFAHDHAAIQSYCDENAEMLAKMPFDGICALISGEFPRTAAVEVLDQETRCGVLLYPNWP
jgi:hypothetical protein